MLDGPELGVVHLSRLCPEIRCIVLLTVTCVTFKCMRKLRDSTTTYAPNTDQLNHQLKQWHRGRRAVPGWAAIEEASRGSGAKYGCSVGRCI